MVTLITAVLTLYQLATATPDPLPTSIRVWGNVERAKSIRVVYPELPISCDTGRMSVLLLAEAWISAKGDVQRVRIVKPVFGGDSNELGREASRRAIDAIRSWKFAPATVDGHAVASVETYAVNFRCPDRPPN